MKNLGKRIVTIGLASALGVFAVVGSAFAFFTDQVTAKGEKEVVLGYDTTTTEDIKDGNKIITVTNNGQTEVMVRLMVFGAGDDDNDKRTVINPGAGWIQVSADEGQCWQYNNVLSPVGTDGSSATEFRIDLAEGASGDDFEVIVIGQCSAVYYGDDGLPHAYNWDKWKEVL